MIECNWFGVAKEYLGVRMRERESAIKSLSKRNEMKCEARTQTEANDINRLCRINVQNEQRTTANRSKDTGEEKPF